MDDFLIEVLLVLAPTIIFIAFFIIGILNIEKALMFWGIGGILFVISLWILLNRTHKNSDYRETNVTELLGEVKVSNVTSIPCILEGRIIGRGNPGCIFNEDFVLRDETGFIFLDYNQFLHVVVSIFVICKTG